MHPVLNLRVKAGKQTPIPQISHRDFENKRCQPAVLNFSFPRICVFLILKQMLMKYIVWLALLWATEAKAQECTLVRDTDPFTRKTRISTGFINLPDGRLNIECDGKEIDLFFIVNGKCFQDNSNIYVYFDGIKARMTYRNTGSMNCDGYVHVKYRNQANPNTMLKRFTTHKVTQIVFVDADKKEKVMTLNEEQQTALQKLATCLVDEAVKMLGN